MINDDSDAHKNEPIEETEWMERQGDRERREWKTRQTKERSTKIL